MQIKRSDVPAGSRAASGDVIGKYSPMMMLPVLAARDICDVIEERIRCMREGGGEDFFQLRNGESEA